MVHLAFCFSCSESVVVFEDRLDLGVDARLFVLIQLDAGEAALVEDRNRCPILDGTADVVDIDIRPEDSRGVHILGFNRGACEPDEGGIRQSLADVMSIAIPALAGCLVELGVEAILAAMRLVRDDDDVSPVGQQREVFFPGSGANFWTVVKMTPPEARLSKRRSSSRLSACSGVWRIRSRHRLKVPNS